MLPNPVLGYHIIQGSIHNHGTRFSAHYNLIMCREKVLQHLVRFHILSKQQYNIISCCALLLFETTLQNLVCGYHIIQGSVNNHVTSCSFHSYLPIGIYKEFATPPQRPNVVLPTIQHHFMLNLATS